MKNINLLIQIFSISIFAALCFLTPPYISYFIILILFVRVFFFLRTTKGEPIKNYESPQQALLLLDVQEIMCGDKGFYPSKVSFIKEINKLINDAQQSNQHIIYVRQEFLCIDVLFCLLGMGGRLLQGLKSTSLCSSMIKIGNVTFVKHQQDAFTSKQLNSFLIENEVKAVSIVGLDATSCVYKTAMGAKNRGYDVTVIRSGVLGKNVAKTDNILQRLSVKGIKIY